MLSLKAKIRLLRTDEGGMRKPGFSGMQPSFSVAGDLIAARVIPLDGREEIALGEELAAQIDLAYGERYAAHISEGLAFNLQIGGHVIGTGVVTDVLG